MSDATYDRDYWEDRYSGHGGHGRGGLEASPHLIAEIARLEPGSALDAGCGTGTDTLWLAGQGWRVTAVDIAQNALETARARVQEIGAPVAERVHWQREDLTTWEPPAGGYTLVHSHYVHTDAPRPDLYRRLATAVAPGGTLLVVGHHPDGLHGDAAHAGHHGTQLTAQEVADLLDPGEWTVETADARVRTATVGDGREITLHDAVLRARRKTAR
ncbi:class I SAM-dependent methyltransferase [Nocardiopsis salina]|uniref:class I SAM-dependent methyltransferase n=1 Tax=Nocardiopsis salina TaxID=245836 RepID=UPI000348DE3B|nr:class I SAM-dependent methyltransferase [Nocardiopsis salina]